MSRIATEAAGLSCLRRRAVRYSQPL